MDSREHELEADHNPRQSDAIVPGPVVHDNDKDTNDPHSQASMASTTLPSTSTQQHQFQPLTADILSTNPVQPQPQQSQPSLSTILQNPSNPPPNPPPKSGLEGRPLRRSSTATSSGNGSSLPTPVSHNQGPNQTTQVGPNYVSRSPPPALPYSELLQHGEHRGSFLNNGGMPPPPASIHNGHNASMNNRDLARSNTMNSSGRRQSLGPRRYTGTGTPRPLSEVSAVGGPPMSFDDGNNSPMSPASPQRVMLDFGASGGVGNGSMQGASGSGGNGGGPGSDDSQFKMPRLQRSVEERLKPTVNHAHDEAVKANRKAMLNTYALNVATGLQVFISALITALAAVTTGRKTQIMTSVLGGAGTLVASFLARARYSNEPEFSKERANILKRYIRQIDAFIQDHGHEVGPDYNEQIAWYRHELESILDTGKEDERGEPRMKEKKSPV